MGAGRLSSAAAMHLCRPHLTPIQCLIDDKSPLIENSVVPLDDHASCPVRLGKGMSL